MHARSVHGRRGVTVTDRQEKSAAWGFYLLLLGGAVLRLAFFWINPPENVFDNHLEPIQRILATGKIPAVDACWQCYQPPVFYLFSAILAKLALGVQLPAAGLDKFLQFVTCFFSLLNLWVLMLIVRRFPFPNGCRLLLFALICVLPRDVYMAGMHSNDTATYFAISLSVYLAMRLMTEDRLWLPVALGVVGSLALLTKYTAFVVIPVILAAVGWRFLSSRAGGLKMIRGAAVAVLLPVLVLGSFLTYNQHHYGRLLPHNDQLFDPATRYVRESATADFVSFTPWKFIQTPLLVPGQVSSFWTVAYTGLWFDTEPRYVTFVGGDLRWWEAYMGWLRGKGPFPGVPVALPPAVKIVGSVLEAVGLVPLLLAGIGGVAAARTAMRRQGGALAESGLAVLLFLLGSATVAGIVILAIKMPVFSAMKASYFLGAVPAFGYFIGRGLSALPEKSVWRPALNAGLVAVILFCVVHLLQVISQFRLPLT